MGVVKCLNPKCSYWDNDEPDNCSHPFRPMSDCQDAILGKVTARKEKSFYIEELESTECQCGAGKKRMKPFCYCCFLKLPQDIQVRLYSGIGRGYEEAFEEAIKFLED